MVINLMTVAYTTAVIDFAETLKSDLVVRLQKSENSNHTAQTPEIFSRCFSTQPIGVALKMFMLQKVYALVYRTSHKVLAVVVTFTQIYTIVKENYHRHNTIRSYEARRLCRKVI